MTRVATIPLQQTLAAGIQRAQQRLAVAQTQLATGRKSETLAGLGADLVPNLSARNVLARQEAQGAVTSRVGTTLSVMSTSISGVETIGSDLRQSIVDAIASGSGGTALQDSFEFAFNSFSAQLNSAQAGVPLFSGSQPGSPFKPQSLSEAAGLDPADAFSNDNVLASARVADNIDLQYGVTASELGTDMLAAFRTLAEAGPLGTTLTQDQISVLRTALGQVDGALDGVRSISAQVGRKQAQVETLGARSADRVAMLQDIVSQHEDADLGQVAVDIAQQKSVLDASYGVFGQLSGMSLLDFLR